MFKIYHETVLIPCRNSIIIYLLGAHWIPIDKKISKACFKIIIKTSASFANSTTFKDSYLFDLYDE